MPSAMSVQCFAHLGQDVSEALPYVNAVLGGSAYIREPASVTFKVHGKLITIHGRKIAVNALKDKAEAIKIVEWLKREINAAWTQRDRLEPKYDGLPRPQMLEILKRLPKTNCGDCGAPTCLVFAAQMVEGAKGSGDCPALSSKAKTALDQYMRGFGMHQDAALV